MKAAEVKGPRGLLLEKSGECGEKEPPPTDLTARQYCIQPPFATNSREGERTNIVMLDAGRERPSVPPQGTQVCTTHRKGLHWQLKYTV